MRTFDYFNSIVPGGEMKSRRLSAIAGMRVHIERVEETSQRGLVAGPRRLKHLRFGVLTSEQKTQVGLHWAQVERRTTVGVRAAHIGAALHQ